MEDEKQNDDANIARKTSRKILDIPGADNLEFKLERLKNDMFSHHDAIDKTMNYYNIIKNLDVSIQERMEDANKELEEIGTIMKSDGVATKQWRESDNIWYKVAKMYDKALKHLYSVMGSMNWQWRFLTEERALMPKLTGLVQKSWETGKDQVKANMLLDGLKEMKSRMQEQADYQKEITKSFMEQQQVITRETVNSMINAFREIKDMTPVPDKINGVTETTKQTTTGLVPDKNTRNKMLIQDHKKGISIPDLMKKYNLQERTILNIVSGSVNM